MYVDTHSHIYLKDFADEIDTVIENAKESSVNRIYLPNIDASSITDVKRLASKYPKDCYPQMGLHPCYVKEDYSAQLDAIEKELFNGAYTAVGEIGIDLYWDKTFKKEQEKVFRTQIEWSKDLDLPFVIHSRDSLELTIDTVSKMQNGKLSGIFHCFNGTEDQAKQILDIGFYIGIGGVLTFKNSGLDKTLESIALEGMVLETDAPYLAPVPFRGKQNQPAYIKLIAEKLSEVKGVTPEEVGLITTKNANLVYQFTPEQV